MTGYSAGIRVNAGATVHYVKITNGVMDIVSVASGDDMGFKLTTCNIDTTNNIISGYDASGNRYIFDKESDVTVTLV
tara:strand:- start:5662 stop:5892 length:231 start_codon:yes stop_codon:yes gene_type:complete